MKADFLRALDAAAKAGRTIPVWLRDDDATVPTPALDRLLLLDVPVTLAVIPRDTGAGLAARLHDVPHIDVAVHGWAHENHATPPAKKQELGDERRLPLVLAELQQGRDKIRALFGAQAIDMIVPPWNRISADVAAALPDLGFRVLSTFGPERSGPIPMLNTHIDPIDWHGTRSLRPDPWHAAAERLADGGTLGLLTHHLQHDDAVWDFVADFIATTRGHDACRWVSSRDLVRRP